MLPIHLFRTSKEQILEGLKKKNFKETELVHRIISIDEQRRELQVENDNLAASVNSTSKSIGQLMAKGDKAQAEHMKAQVAIYKDQAKAAAEKLAFLETELQQTLVLLPNLPHSSVPMGKTPEENEVVREGGEFPALTEQKLPHWDLAAKYSLMDLELGNKITGAGFPVFMGQGARLQRSLINYFLNYNTAAGYKEYCPPFMVNEASAYGTGQLPDKEGQMYHVSVDGFYLIPTAEVPVTNIYRDTIIPESELPGKNDRLLSMLSPRSRLLWQGCTWAEQGTPV